MNFARLFTVLCFLISGAFASAYAKETINNEAIALQLKEQHNTVELISQVLSESAIDEVRLLEFRQTLRLSRTELQNIVDIVKPLNVSAQADLTDLGVVPEGENAVVEPDNIQKLRAELTRDSLALEGLLKQAEALSSKATRLLEKITSLRRMLFLNGLFEQQMSPFNIDLWKGAKETFFAQLSSLKLIFEDKVVLAPVIISSILFLVIFSVASFLSKKRLRIKLQDESEKKDILSMVSVSLFTPFLAIRLGLFITYQTLITQSIINETNGLYTK